MFPDVFNLQKHSRFILPKPIQPMGNRVNWCGTNIKPTSYVGSCPHFRDVNVGLVSPPIHMGNLQKIYGKYGKMVYKPHDIVISPIYHSIQPLIRQLNAIDWGPHIVRFESFCSCLALTNDVSLALTWIHLIPMILNECWDYTHLPVVLCSVYVHQNIQGLNHDYLEYIPAGYLTQPWKITIFNR